MRRPGRPSVACASHDDESQAAAAVVEGVLSREAGFVYGRGLDRARARVEAAVADLNAQNGPFKPSLVMQGLSVGGLAFDGERMIISASAQGQVRAEVVSIPLAAP